jgi:hypothetical protein
MNRPIDTINRVHLLVLEEVVEEVIRSISATE